MNKLKSSLILLLWFRLVPYSANNTHIKPPVCRLEPLPCSGHLHCVLFIYVVFCSLTLFSVQLHVFRSSQFLASSASLCISGTKAVTVFSRKFLKLLQVKLAMYWQRFFPVKGSNIFPFTKFCRWQTCKAVAAARVPSVAKVHQRLSQLRLFQHRAKCCERLLGDVGPWGKRLRSSETRAGLFFQSCLCSRLTETRSEGWHTRPPARTVGR